MKPTAPKRKAKRERELPLRTQVSMLKAQFEVLAQACGSAHAQIADLKDSVNHLTAVILAAQSRVSTPRVNP